MTATAKCNDYSSQLNPQQLFSPMRKTLSLSVLFRTERAVRSRPSSDAVDESTSKRKRRISLRRSPASTTSSLFSSPSESPQSACSSSSSNKRSSRISRVASRCLFPDSSFKLEEEEFVPPQRPTCPAPLLDLSFEGLSILDKDPLQITHITRLHSDILGRLSTLCPSEESFYCRGLEQDVEIKKTLPRSRKRRPTMTSILAPSALKLRPKNSLLAMDSDLSSSPSSSVYSFETTPEATEHPYHLTHSTPSPQIRSSSLGLMCPASPPPKVRLQLTLPPTANLARHLILLVDSNASTLELKETLCSTLLHQLQFSISPSNIALSFLYRDDEPARVLENSRPLYQEGLQDDDEILVLF